MARIRAKLPDEDAAVLDGWLSSAMPIERVSAALRAYGSPCSAASVLRHRRGLCMCGST